MVYLVGALVAAALVGAAVQAAEPEVTVLSEEQRVKSPGTAELAFTLPAVPAGRQVRLELDARVDWPSLSGFNPWVLITLNGKALTGPDLLNKPVEFTTRNGVEFVWEKGTLWTVLYSPDFSDTVRTQPMPWGFADTDPYHFTWNITPYVRAGENKLAFHHPQLLADGTTLVLRGVRLVVGDPVPSQAAGDTRPAPAGPLATYMPGGRRPVAMDVALAAGGALRVQVAGHTFTVRSRTSEPEGRWAGAGTTGWRRVARGKSATARWSGTGYTVTRTVRVRTDHVHVADTIANTSDGLAGILYENRLDLAGHPGAKVLLAGRPPYGAEMGVEEPAHPSAIAEWKGLALGLFAEDDIFRVHVKAFTAGKTIGLADPRLGIAPGKSHTLEWSLYPAPGGSYWDVINAVRRNWGSNIPVLGPGLFDQMTDGSHPQEHYQDMVASRRLKLVFSGQTAFLGDEVRDGIDLAEGTAITMARRWCTSAAEWVRKLHAADPGVKTFIYLHPTICTEPGAEKRYADCRLLDPGGAHVTSPYRYPVYQYIPTTQNAYGRELYKTLERIFAEINPDGIYMDEFQRGSMSQYAYHTEWDGCTVDIDPRTHAVTGKCSSTVLLMQPWKAAMVRFLRARGKLLVGNSPAHTRTTLGWKALLFTELNSYSFLTEMHLSTPWALGNHDNDNDDRVRARMVRRALDLAGVIEGYSWGDRPEGLHYLALMYPITPLELRPGMILGKERIVTNRSGRYGWPDGSAAEVYVFDGAGKHVPHPQAKTVRVAGRALTEVRMPGDHFAVLVRKAPAR